MAGFKMVARFLAGLALTLALLSGAPYAARAQELYVVTEEYAPYNMVKNGEIVGYSTEVLRAVLKRAGIGYRIELLPWSRALRIALYAKDVLIYTIARTPEREDRFHWIGPIASREDHMFRLASRPEVAPTDEASLLDYRVGVVRDAASQELMLRLGFEVGKNLTILQDNEGLLRLLDAGRIDIAPSNFFGFRRAIQESHRALENYVPCYSIKCEGGFYFGISRGSNRWLIERVSEAFAALEQDGTLEAIKNRHYIDRDP